MWINLSCFGMFVDDLDVLMCRSTPDKEGGAAEVLSGSEAIEGFVVGLYSEAFQAVISLINRYFGNCFIIFL